MPNASAQKWIVLGFIEEYVKFNYVTRFHFYTVAMRLFRCVLLFPDKELYDCNEGFQLGKILYLQSIVTLLYISYF